MFVSESCHSFFILRHWPVVTRRRCILVGHPVRGTDLTGPLRNFVVSDCLLDPAGLIILSLVSILHVVISIETQNYYPSEAGHSVVLPPSSQVIRFSVH